MARITEASKQAVLDRLDAVAVVEDYLRLEKKSGRYWGLCPFHHEKTPSFTVDPDRKLYYCFGCHKGGTVVDFIMEMDKLSFGEALETLAKKFGIELAYESGNFAPDTERRNRLDALSELYRRVAVSFHHLLMEKPEGEPAKRYILGRGITADTINRFRLGYSPADRHWLFRFLLEKGGFSEEFLAASGLFSSKYPKAAFFSNRLMFPIDDRQGKTVAFGGRILSGDGPKYINSGESELFRKGHNLFALDLALPDIRSGKTAVLAEGYMDVLALHQAQVRNAVAPLGTAFTDDQARLLKRWVDTVVLMLDADEAGQTAAEKTILVCRKNGIACSVAVFSGENAKDPAEILYKFGADTLQKFVKSSILDFDYLLSRSRALPGDKSRAAAFLFPYLAVLDSEVSRDSCIGVIADEYGVNRRAVQDDYNRYISGGELRTRHGAPGRGPAGKTGDGAPEKTAGAPRGIGVPRMNGELYLLTVVFLHPRFYKELRAKFSAEELEDPHARELFIILEEWFRNSENGADSPEGHQELFSRVTDEALRDFVMRQSAGGAFDAPEQIVADGITRVESRILERRRSEIVRQLRVPGLDGLRQEDLLAEKVHIDSELTRLNGADR
ncbi:MAG: DNA primase [Treponema sp.]|jgi:DNA primase|nr:DNA primase [Treponema sp.]